MSDEVKTNEETGEIVGTNNDARLALLDKIADQNESERAEELAHVNDDDTTEPFKIETKPDENEEEKTESLPEEKKEEAPRKFKLKIDGEELELTEDEVIARAQKVSAADKYLAEAAAARRAALAETETKPAGPSAEEIQRQQDEEDRALVRAIQMGTEEEATAALRKLREQASRSTSITPDDVARTIDQRLSFNEAVSMFRKDFSDIASDPYLNKMAIDMDSQLLEAGDRRSYSERYAEIGKKIRAWKESLVAKTEDSSTTTTLADKQQRKEAAPKVPVTASAKTTKPPEEDDQDDDPSTVIAKMRQQRGGPQWMRS